MSTDPITGKIRFSKKDTDFQPGEKVEIIHEGALKRYPNIEKIGTIQSIKSDGGRIVKTFNHNTNEYETLSMGLRTSLKKAVFVPDELFELD